MFKSASSDIPIHHTIVMLNLILYIGSFQHEEAYAEILKGVKGGSSEKRLSSQFIARFFKYFPGLAEEAINAQLDLCEDEDIAVRLFFI